MSYYLLNSLSSNWSTGTVCSCIWIYFSILLCYLYLNLEIFVHIIIKMYLFVNLPYTLEGLSKAYGGKTF